MSLGPHAQEKVQSLLSEAQRQVVSAMKPFYGVELGDLFIATTGYTGEAGYEIARHHSLINNVENL